MRSVVRIQRWIIAIVLLALAAPLFAQNSALPLATIEAVDRTIVQINSVRENGGRVSRGSGSGIIVDQSGLILTAEHVVNRTTQLEVVLRTGEALPARVVGVDPVFDSALMRVDARRPLPTASLGVSSLLQQGDLVTVFGRAPRRQGSPTSGVFIEVDLDVRPGAPYLRSTAVAYPGDSGGALVNERGEVVGLIVAISRDGSISLSVAVDAVKGILPDLRAGVVRHPWIGIIGTTITDELAQELALAVRSGVLILEVVEGGPAAQAGLRGGRAGAPRDIPRGGDVIAAIDGRPVATFGGLAAYILSKRIGDTVTLDIIRNGQAFTTTVVLAERPTL